MPYLKILSVFLILNFAFSCSKKDSVNPESCVYLGSSYNFKYPSGFHEEQSSSVILRADGLLEEASIEFFMESESYSAIDKRKYLFVYDSDGFLKQQTTIKSFDKNEKLSFYYGSLGPFKKVLFLTTETSDFSYSSGKVSSVITTTVSSIKGDSQSPVLSTVRSTRKYTYNAEGSLSNSIENFDNGDVGTTTYKNGIRSSYVLVSNGQKQTINYNEMNLASEHILPTGSFILKYDGRGNLTLVEQITNNFTNFRQEFKYDDHPNPQILIPSKFKGIPDPISTIQTSSGVNNLLQETTENFQANQTVSQNFSLTYNASGYPETSSVDIGTGSDLRSRITTYRYQNCP